MSQEEQATTPGRTTVLEAVNVMLESIGEMPVPSLEGTGPAECRIALRCLLEVHKEGQTRGWSWNTDEGFPFSASGRHEINLPANVVRWIPDRYAWGRRFQARGQRIWDREKLSYRLPPECHQLLADVVWLLPFDECPEQFNRWITMRASRTFAARVLGNDSLVKFTMLDEEKAFLELQRMEAEQANWNILTDGMSTNRPQRTYEAGRSLVERAAYGAWIGGNIFG